jgi:hypothetical protein
MLTMARLKLGAGILVGLFVAFALYVRLAPSDPTRWHVDQITAEGTGKPNEFRLAPSESPSFPVGPGDLAWAFDRMAMAQPRVRRLAGGPEELLTTYVQRSFWMGFPDYISVREVDLGNGRSAFAIWSRSRFGYSDLGVNRARVESWLAALPAE